MKFKKEIFILLVLLAIGVGYLVYESMTKDSNDSIESVNTTITETTASAFEITSISPVYPSAVPITGTKLENVITQSPVVTHTPTTTTRPSKKPNRHVSFSEPPDVSEFFQFSHVYRHVLTFFFQMTHFQIQISISGFNRN